MPRSEPLANASAARVVTAGVGVGLAAGCNIANTGAVPGVLAEAYGIELPAVGLLTTALFLTHFAAQVPGGTLIDRFGARRIAFAAIAVIVAGNALAATEPSFVLALVARAVIGLGSGAGFVAGSDLVRSAGGSPTLQGLYGGMSIAGGGLAVAVVPALELGLAWRAPYVAAIGLALAVVPLLAVSTGGGRPATARHAGQAASDVLRDRRLYSLAALHTATFGVGVVLGNWIVPLLVDEGMSRGAAGVAGALVLLGGLVTRPLGGWAVRTYPHRARQLVAGSLVAAATGTFVLASGAALPLLAAAAAVVGLAVGIPFATAFTGAQRLRPDAPAAAVGVVNAAATLAIVVGTPLLGLTFSLPGGGRLGFGIAGALVLAAAAATRRAPHLL